MPIFTASVDRPSTANVAVSCSIQFSSRKAGWPTVTRAAAAGALRTGSSRKATATASFDAGPLHRHRERGRDVRFGGLALDRLDDDGESVDDGGAVVRHVGDGFDGRRGGDLIDEKPAD